MKTIKQAQLDRDVLFHLSIHRGKGDPIGRWELVEKIFGRAAREPESDENLYDRHVRASVERLRVEGHLICDMGDGRGRYLASTADQYWAFRMKYGSHAFQILETIGHMDGAAGRQFGEVVQAMRRKGPDVSLEFETLYQPALL